MLLAHGHGVENFTFRQFLNICYTLITDTMTGSGEEGGDTPEEQVQRFEEQIGLRHNPDDDAIAALRAFQISQGIDPDKKKVDIEKEIPWWEKDTEM